MPNQRAPGQVDPRVWMPKELWAATGQVADAQGITRGEAIRAFLRWYTGEPDAELPTPAARTVKGDR